MALAFFTAPITTLGSFGFGKPASSSSESNLRPESMSAGAIIKCSDCGGDVVLAELGEHVCNPSNQEKDENEAPESDKEKQQSEVMMDTPRTPKAEKASGTQSDTSSREIREENRIKPIQLESQATDDSSSRSSSTTMSPPSTKTSSSEFSLSNSEPSTSSASMTGRTPFFEKYAQLMPSTTKNPAKPALKSANQARDRLKLSSKKNLSPITSPERSPQPKPADDSQFSKERLPTSRSTPFSNLPDVGIASQRREAANRRLREEKKLVESSSEPSGLNKLRGTPQELSIRTANLTNRQKPRNADPEPKLSSSRTPTKDRWKDRPNPSGLEDLMGDLMAEMEKKAEVTSEEYKYMSRRTPAKSNVRVPENPTGRFQPGLEVEERTDRKVKADDYPDHTPTSYSRPPTGSDPSNDSPTPSSPGIKPSDSISQLGYARSPSPKLVRGLKIPQQDSAQRCQRCGESPIRHVKNPTTDEARFCRQCYAALYLPKCRKCSKPIERGAVTDRVGKVLGKYHSNCFNCFQCSAPFPNGEFYVWERKPVCFKHYHRLAGTTCCNESCGQGIEGPCVSLILEGSSVGSVLSDDSSHSNVISNSSRRKLYHPEHFTCSRRGCRNSLHEFHFVLNGLPWCEHHALQEQDQIPRMMRQNRLPSREEKLPHGGGRPPPPGLPPSDRSRVERRRTIIQNVRNR